MRTPADLLQELVSGDATSPRVTCYDDSPGAGGERIELSAHVLANWVAKAANALQGEWDLGPGSRVRLALPPHWRTVYWAYAVWSIGACVLLDDDSATPAAVDLTVSDDPVVASAGPGPGVLVTLAALARQSNDQVSPDTMDEARELANYPDEFDAWAAPAATDPALVVGAELTAYGQLLDLPTQPDRARVHIRTGDTADFLRTVLATWAAGGSVVLSRGAGGRDLDSRLVAEAVTLDLGAGQ